ncbi:MAG: hypothetical protein DMF25_07445 [Verrucomicrobia bacterium]|nr:MAG: hypothetical protein DMF25_07445 [Verrucomicrobiota bacterium]
MSLSFKHVVIAVCSLIALFSDAFSSDAESSGFLEGHLKIFSLKEVELADGNLPTKLVAGDYAEYPLIIRSRDGQKEVTRVIADKDGNYRLTLPPGEYMLDVQRPSHLRAKPQPFAVVSNQTVRVDMDIDTGIR